MRARGRGLAALAIGLLLAAPAAGRPAERPDRVTRSRVVPAQKQIVVNDVVRIAADGDGVAVQSRVRCGDAALVWRPLRNRITRLPVRCWTLPRGAEPNDSQSLYEELTIAGARLFWAEYDLPSVEAYCRRALTTTLAAPARRRPVAPVRCDPRRPRPDFFFDAFGDGALLAVSSYDVDRRLETIALAEGTPAAPIDIGERAELLDVDRGVAAYTTRGRDLEDTLHVVRLADGAGASSAGRAACCVAPPSSRAASSTRSRPTSMRRASARRAASSSYRSPRSWPGADVGRVRVVGPTSNCPADLARATIGACRSRASSCSWPSSPRSSPRTRSAAPTGPRTRTRPPSRSSRADGGTRARRANSPPWRKRSVAAECARRRPRA